MVELNSITISQRQTDELKIFVKKRPTFKRGHKVLEGLSLKMLVAKGGFEAKLSLINSSSKGLIYFKNIWSFVFSSL